MKLYYKIVLYDINKIIITIPHIFQLIFSLFSGLKSYGKVVFLFSLVPAFGMLVLCTKLLGLTPHGTRLHMVFPQTDWSEFFLNSKVIFLFY